MKKKIKKRKFNFYNNKDNCGMLSLQTHCKIYGEFGNEKIINTNKIAIVIDYPIRRPYIFVMENKDGFSRQELYDGIFDAYQEIYNGKDMYGIWGHDLGDLSFVDIEEIRKDAFEIGVDS